MANVLYPKFKQRSISGQIALPTDVVKVTLVTSGYTYSSAHEFYSSVTAGTRIATSAALATKTVTNGVFDADDTSFPSVAAGSTGAALIVWVDTGTEATSALVAFIDIATGLPVTTNGGNINVVWNVSGIFAL